MSTNIDNIRQRNSYFIYERYLKSSEKKDYELKDINVKEYIGKYNKLYKDYKTILKMGLMYM